MRVAICDGDKTFLLQFKKAIYLFARKNKLEIVVECFVSGEEFLRSDNNYNLIFLGYYLDDIDGLETAVNLRDSGDNTPIIFVSDYTGFIFDSFRVNPYAFLLKREWQDRLFPLLEEIFAKKGENYPIFVKDGGDIVCINTENIYYLEADNKCCYIHLSKETLYCHKTMAQVFDVLPKSHFCKTNRAFVVNLRHISRYNNDMIKLKNGKEIHPSRKYFKDFKEEYRRFLKPIEV
jgi:DNA-binding LytR/AlgR family response regulator